MTPRAVRLIYFALVASLSLALAQAIGYWVNIAIPQYSTVELNSLIHLTHIRNFGGVFGLLQGSGWLFALISAMLLGGIIVYLALGRTVRHYEYICFGFIVGGGASNILDRLVYGSVIDYIDIQHIPWWHYVFNVADVMVHLGIWPLLLLSILHERKRV
ncbi:MAG: signal peptidase II [Pseudohongiellaceae bacterium]